VADWVGRLSTGRWTGGLSLRVKITLAFIVIVVGGASVSTIIGSRIITRALLAQASLRVSDGLESARSVYDERLGQVQVAVVRTARTEQLAASALDRQYDRIAAELATVQRDAQLDLLGYFDGAAGLVVRPGNGIDRDPRRGSALGQMIVDAMQGATVAGTEVISAEALGREGLELAQRAFLPIVPVPFAAPDPRTELTAGLALVAASPVFDGDRPVGVIYGGVLLNRSSDIVDKVKRLVYGRAQFNGRDIGSASIFLSDVRVATNVRNEAGERALGSRASAEVANAVLRDHRAWYGRAFVVDDWYVAAYQPLRNRGGEVIGILYTGMLEAPFLAVRTDVMLTFLVVALAGVLVVLGLTYLITRTMIRPLEEMVVATQRIANGDLERGVKVRSRDEVGDLARAFNQMVISLRTTQAELEKWGHTLEEKVRERSEQLIHVQSAMAQSEKLASLGRLAAGVAHEINNPLGGILAVSSLDLEDCAESSPLRKDLELIVKQTLRCREIVKGLLDFSRQSEARAIRVDVNQIVESSFGLVKRQAIFHDVRTGLELHPGLPPVHIDPGQLQQVVINIVLNAVDAMEGHGALSIVTSRDSASGGVQLSISDTGKGVPAEILPMIFEPFFTTKKVGEGTGLGLAIVHGIVARAGGRIDVASAPGRTTFTVRLPVASDDAGADEARS